MKKITLCSHFWSIALVIMAGVNFVAAQGTAFTYQGLLNSGGGPASGSYDLTFSLFNASAGGTQAGGTVTDTGVAVSNGVFTVTVDFGAVFTGTAYWLQIGVRPTGGGAFTALSPRQQLTPAPYSITAENVTGAVSLAQLPATVGLLNDSGDGNFFAGQSSGNSTVTGAFNVGFGSDALESIQGGSYNEADGVAALYANTTGSDNAANGYAALYDNTVGYGNTANGAFSLELNLAGNYNSANGYNALGENSSGNYNTANGYYALEAGSTASDNTADGAYAMGYGYSSTGGGNTASGAYGLYHFTTGYNNTAAGLNSLYSDTTGFDNIGVGVSTFYTNSAGYQNTAIGTYAFQNMTVGNGNIGIGYFAGGDLVAGTNNIYIGNYGSSSDNEVIRIGDGQTKTFISGTTVGINNDNPTEALDVGGEFMVIEGASGLRCYLGDDGAGNDVQVGSLKSGVTAVSLYNETDNAYMHLYCSSISIEGGSDLAEPFPISTPGQQVSEGEVVIIDEANPGHLKIADQAYDTRVAGVVSGANGINPGIQMQQQGLLEGGKNVALTGRVYVQADTSNGSIKPGDLLTTSATPGRAMKVSDHLRAQGAILGKAMSGLKDGKGMVLVLVTLQ